MGRGSYRMPSVIASHARQRFAGMSLIWDLIQHGQISGTKRRAESLEQRVAELEDDLRLTNETLMQLLQAMEQRFGEDLDGDGHVGRPRTR